MAADGWVMERDRTSVWKPQCVTAKTYDNLYYDGTDERKGTTNKTDSERKGRDNRNLEKKVQLNLQVKNSFV